MTTRIFAFAAVLALVGCNNDWSTFSVYERATDTGAGAEAHQGRRTAPHLTAHEIVRTLSLAGYDDVTVQRTESAFLVRQSCGADHKVNKEAIARLIRFTAGRPVSVANTGSNCSSQVAQHKPGPRARTRAR